jgi:RNA helicase HrpA
MSPSSEKSSVRVKSWDQLSPNIGFPSALPVSRRSNDITEAIQKHRVLIIAGETGSGKTTQVPKCAILAGLGKSGRVIMTQPRRLAAVRTAIRIAEELGVQPGDEVGYRVRFQHKASKDGLLEVVTDGIPLSGDLSKHPFKDCDAVIVDEVHERSINIDLLLGLLKNELKRRPDFKVILMSATLDTERYQNFFPDAHAMQVEGRTYPVDTFYREPDRHDSTVDSLCKGVEEAMGNSSGDILCFLATERDIRDAERRLQGRLGSQAEVLPLFSRLSQKDQDRVFRPSGGKRRIILSTNIAETSLTLPGVRCVVDSGQARILRYQAGRGVPLLEIESISKASAKQRAGRAGRTAPGICLRLYNQRTYLAMEEFTPPEIQRQDLSQVILKLVSMGVREPNAFPFPDPPSHRAMKSGEQLLEFLGAVKRKEDGLHLTKMGKDMVRLPLSPRLSHLMLRAKRENLLLPISVVSSFLSMQDPRQNPAEELSKARDAHRKYRVEGSDFLGMLKLYGRYQQQSQNLSGNALKRWCSENYLSWRRMKEWEQLILELGKTVDSDFRLTDLGDVAETTLHQLILASHLDCLLEPDAKAQDDSYHSLGRRGIFAHPSSSLGKKPKPKSKQQQANKGQGPSKTNRPWAVCASFLTTSKLFALHLCHIEPHWISDLAPHLIQIERGEPRYDEKSQKVVSEEIHRFRSHVVKTIPSKDHFPHDPDTATDVFIREALIRNPAPMAELENGLKTMEQLKHLDAAMRTREQCHNEDRMVEAWKNKIGACSRFSDFKKIPKEQLKLSLEDILTSEELQMVQRDTPLVLLLEEQKLDIQYNYRPEKTSDGACILMDAQQLALFDERRLSTSIPAWRKERSRLAWESLPKAFRKQFSLEQCQSTWDDMSLEKPEHSDRQIWKRWISKHTSLDDVIQGWFSAIEKSIHPYLWPKFSLIDKKGEQGPLLNDVQDAQLHNRSAMAEKHLRQLQKKDRQKLISLEGDALERIETVLNLWNSWPIKGRDAQNISGEIFKLYPRFYIQHQSIWVEPHPDEELSRHQSLNTLAKIHGPLSSKAPEAQGKIIEALAKTQIPLSEWIPQVQHASWLKLWKRMRDGDLKSLDKLRERLKKCEAKYWGKDFEQLLQFSEKCTHLHLRSKWLHPKTSQEHWLSKQCGIVSYHGYPKADELAKIDLDKSESSMNRCLVLLEEQHQHPNGFDAICKAWRNMDKEWNTLKNHPLYEVIYTEASTWTECVFPKGWDNASASSLKKTQDLIKERMETLKLWQKRWSDSEDWLIFAQDDVESECHAKTRNRKKQLLDDLLQNFEKPEQRKTLLKDFYQKFEPVREKWSQLRSQKKVVLEEEKIVGKDKLKDALMMAWGSKK